MLKAAPSTSMRRLAVSTTFLDKFIEFTNSSSASPIISTGAAPAQTQKKQIATNDKELLQQVMNLPDSEISTTQVMMG
jgi:hypothetical protein